MNYRAQEQYLQDVFERYPEFKKELLKWRAKWDQPEVEYVWIVVGGHPISDYVIAKVV